MYAYFLFSELQVQTNETVVTCFAKFLIFFPTDLLQ